jgi:hypothetical protein
LDAAYLRAMNSREGGHDRLERARANPYLDGVDLRVMERELDARRSRQREEPEPEPVYQVRHLERLPLGTPYTEVVRRIKALVSRPPLHGRCTLAVDATGVGAAVVDQLRAARLTFEAVTITAGYREAEIEPGSWRVPKKDLIARPQVLLQKGNRRLKIASNLPEAQTLVDELLNYRYKITDAGNDTYAAWREGDHDDLVLALALAVWAAERFGGAPVDRRLVGGGGPYKTSPKNLYKFDDSRGNREGG